MVLRMILKLPCGGCARGQVEPRLGWGWVQGRGGWVGGAQEACKLCGEGGVLEMRNSPEDEGL